MPEGVGVLAARQPSRHGAVLAATAAGHTHVLVDGTLLHTDRVSPAGPTPGVDAWWSGKHAQPGGTVAVVAAAEGWPRGTSGVRPGRAHDTTAARADPALRPGIRDWVTSGAPARADLGDEGDAGTLRTPINRPKHGEPSADQQTYQHRPRQPARPRRTGSRRAEDHRQGLAPLPRLPRAAAATSPPPPGSSSTTNTTAPHDHHDTTHRGQTVARKGSVNLRSAVYGSGITPVGADPRQLQFDFALWTREMIRELIRREFGVSLSVVSIGRLLTKLGLSAQRPLYRVYQQNPEAVEEFTTRTYPTLRAQAEAEGATIYFADEAGIRSDYHAGTTWAPSGQTPVVTTTGARHSINMISAVTAQGALRFAVYAGALNAGVFIDFLNRLLHDAERYGSGPIYLVVDGHPAHRASATKQFVASTNGRLHLVFLPGYSPELNPDEWVWTNVKADRIARAGVTSAEDLKTKAISALRRLQKTPHRVRVFFADPHLASINT